MPDTPARGGAAPVSAVFTNLLVFRLAMYETERGPASKNVKTGGAAGLPL